MIAYDSIQRLKKLINEAKCIVFFGGAGVSTESGIPDFRSAGGLYRKTPANKMEDHYSPEQILHTQFFMRNPQLFYEYYFTHMVHPEAKPNDAHLALVEWERMGKLAAIITQNVDGLHQAAGSRNVIELHGSIHRNACTRCGKTYSLPDVLPFAPGVPYCFQCGSVIKPEVVLYGETLPEDAVNKAVSFIMQADLLIVGGTSLSVYPAAGLIQYFQGEAGTASGTQRQLVLINRDETSYDYKANLVVREKIGQVFHDYLYAKDVE